MKLRIFFLGDLWGRLNLHWRYQLRGQKFVVQTFERSKNLLEVPESLAVFGWKYYVHDPCYLLLLTLQQMRLQKRNTHLETALLRKKKEKTNSRVADCCFEENLMILHNSFLLGGFVFGPSSITVVISSTSRSSESLKSLPKKCWEVDGRCLSFCSCGWSCWDVAVFEILLFYFSRTHALFLNQILKAFANLLNRLRRTVKQLHPYHLGLFFPQPFCKSLSEMGRTK